MLIYLIESYYSGSHKQWVDGLVLHSSHDIRIFTLSGRFWKWRMQGSAITLAKRINECEFSPDLIICSDIIDVGCFRALIKFKDVKVILYMHENQLTYPISKYSKDNYQEISMGYLNYKSCLCADHVIFNTSFHRDVFLDACRSLLSRMPDYNNIDTIELIRSRSSIIPIGFNILEYEKASFNKCPNPKLPTLLYNHRWEHDKRPDLFIKLIDDLINSNFVFRINITNLKNKETIQSLLLKYSHYIKFIGYCDSRKEYLDILLKSDIIPVTADHDFFGISVVEAIYMNCYPLLPSHLCYKEHFVVDHNPYFYKSYDQLLELTKNIISKITFGADIKPAKTLIKSYNWNHVIKNYDMFFEFILMDS